MPKTTPEQNKALVLEAFDTLFNKRDYAAAEKFWSPHYIQHSAHIPPGREGVFGLIKSLPPTLKYEHGTIVAEGNFVMVHGRFSNFGLPANWIAADIVRIENGMLVEHWDVIEDEIPRKGHRVDCQCLAKSLVNDHPATAGVGPKGCHARQGENFKEFGKGQLANDFLVLAEKELSAFIRAVQKLFGAEQARQSALHWIEELERMDWPSGDSIPDWRQATVVASARLALGPGNSDRGRQRLGA
jgi:predicted SnoaL-like aldol condensation-catalyzing enzyme